jgi:hypothetical protein
MKELSQDKEMLVKKKKIMQAALNLALNANPNHLDFRKIPVVPTIKEFLSNEEMPLKPNIVDGCYKDLEDYLSTNYFLMREDYVRDFKNGIQ